MGFYTKLFIIAICIFCKLNICNCNEPFHDHELSSPSSSPPSSLAYPYESERSSSSPLTLPECHRNVRSHSLPKELLLISTLDGRISALDNGKLKWSRVTSPGSLLSSTISNFEVTKRGQIIRVIPSLNGNLYLYNGHTIESVPFTAESYLKSSYKIGDNLVISGGKESRVYGIDILTGHVQYECGISGCPTVSTDNETDGDLLLVKRITQTVRAIEPRTGKEKWHFSVANAQLNIPIKDECHSERMYNESGDQENAETNIKVIVPEGLIKAHGSNEDSSWNYKFDSPIVQIWHFKNGNLIPIDLFDQTNLFGYEEITKQLGFQDYSPTAYVGLHEKQWYVQHSDKLKESEDTSVETIMSPEELNSKYSVMKIEWDNEKETETDCESGNSDEEPERALELYARPKFGLSVLNFEFLNQMEGNRGFYLFESDMNINDKCHINRSKVSDLSNETDEIITEDDENDGIIQHIIIASLWHWWKEVIAISLTISVIINLIMSWFKRNYCPEQKQALTFSVVSSDLPHDTNTPSPSTPSSYHSLLNGDYNAYRSRFSDDFDSIRRLGSGGFGTVFEAKHKIDESNYAVKRIPLPCRKDQREKVMREVKALSKLEHPGIVRYYNAWLEEPPQGWQEIRDKEWDDTEFSSFIDVKSDHVLHSPLNTSINTNKYRDTITSIRLTSESFTSVNESQFNGESFTAFNSKSLDIRFTNGKREESIENSYVAFVDSKCDEKSKNNGSETKTKNDSIKKPDIIPLNFNKCISKLYLYIQMQLCQKNTLKDWLFNNSYLRERTLVFDIFNQIIDAVDYVHSMGLMHRDLKPSNIFFSMDGTIKIGDFGLVTATAESETVHTPAIESGGGERVSLSESFKHTNCVGTHIYMSPELLAGALYSHKVDIFSMGIIFIELLVPFGTEMERIKVLNNIRKRKFPNDFADNNLEEKRFAERLLSYDPEDRPSTNEIKDDLLFRDFRLTPHVDQRARRRTLSQSVSNSSEE